jgi:hypothetical protein
MFTGHGQTGPTPSSTPAAVDHVRQPGVVELGEVDRGTSAGGWRIESRTQHVAWPAVNTNAVAEATARVRPGR